MITDRLGWILIHSHSEYPEENYATPQCELEGEYEPGKKWHWKLYRPINEGGPYTLLFAWEGEIFGEATADVTHAVEDARFNFAFRLTDYEEKKSVALADLPVPRRSHSLITLTPKILAAYHRLTRS